MSSYVTDGDEPAKALETKKKSCAIVIAGKSLVWRAPCRCNCWGGHSVGGDVRCDCWSGRRCAVGIGGESLVWVSLCCENSWGEPGLGVTVPL